MLKPLTIMIGLAWNPTKNDLLICIIFLIDNNVFIELTIIANVEYL